MEMHRVFFAVRGFSLCNLPWIKQLIKLLVMDPDPCMDVSIVFTAGHNTSKIH
jgi:hypothetical protein